MIKYYWSADALFLRVSIDHNMEGRYKPRLHVSVNLLAEV